MIRFLASHPTAANLLMALLIAAGLIALPTLQRETFPDFSTDAVAIDVVYPGASAEEVEEAICQRIEEAVEGLTDLGDPRVEELLIFTGELNPRIHLDFVFVQSLHDCQVL